MKAYEVIGSMAPHKRNLAYYLIGYAVNNGKRFDIESTVKKIVIWESMDRVEQLAVEEQIEEALRR